jgi:hypothetical protein
MTRLRSIITLIALLSQILSVGLMRGGAPPKKCPMSCCAALAKAGLVECACEPTPSVPTTPTPSSLPPAQIREILPQFVWVEEPDFLIPACIHEDSGRSLPPDPVTQPITQPYVRLTVLFCSFLT